MQLISTFSFFEISTFFSVIEIYIKVKFGGPLPKFFFPIFLYYETILLICFYAQSPNKKNVLLQHIVVMVSEIEHPPQ